MSRDVNFLRVPTLPSIEDESKFLNPYLLTWWQDCEESLLLFCFKAHHFRAISICTKTRLLILFTLLYKSLNLSKIIINYRVTRQFIPSRYLVICLIIYNYGRLSKRSVLLMLKQESCSSFTTSNNDHKQVFKVRDSNRA